MFKIAIIFLNWINCRLKKIIKLVNKVCFVSLFKFSLPNYFQQYTVSTLRTTLTKRKISISYN